MASLLAEGMLGTTYYCSRPFEAAFLGVLISLTSGIKSWTEITVNILLNFTYGWAKTNNARQKLLEKILEKEEPIGGKVL